jgi:hypothetical protein
MSWHVHYRNGGEQFRVLAIDRKTAISVACILLRDGHEVVKLESSAGETIETHEVQRLRERRRPSADGCTERLACARSEAPLKLREDTASRGPPPASPNFKRSR